MTTFTKPAKTVDEQLELLVSRGLIVTDSDRLRKYLKHIGYYRMSGYMYPFQSSDGSHVFKIGTTFEQILEHYFFDKKLRILILDYVERIEVSVRAQMCNSFSLAFGPHWHLDSFLFNNEAMHRELVVKINDYCKNPSETFIKSYNSKYNSPSSPPAWMIMETLTFGGLASMYENIKDNDQKKEVANCYGTVVPLFESWLKSINFIRNTCAHHSRLWNRRIPLKPTIPTRKGKRFLAMVDSETDKRLYGILSCMLFVLNSVSPNSKFKERIKALFEEYPNVNIQHMGFHRDWTNEELWR